MYPIPAALTEPTHSIRSIVGAPLFALFSGYGLVQIGEYTRSRKNLRVYRACTVAVLLASVIWYSKLYFYGYRGYCAVWWQKGMKEALEYVDEGPCKCVIFSDDPHFFPAYIFVIFS